MSFPFVAVNAFTANTNGWSTPGNIDSATPDASGLVYTFTFGQRSFIIPLLGPRSFRLRFNPAVNPSYAKEYSVGRGESGFGAGGVQGWLGDRTGSYSLTP